MDLSPSIGAIWLDKGEWELLKKEGLAGSLGAIFTDPWQRNIRDASTRETLDALYTERFGSEDYAKLRELRGWLEEHPKRDHLLAYLVSQDPYSTRR